MYLSNIQVGWLANAIENDISKRRKRLLRMVDILYLSTIPSTLSNKVKPFEVFSILSIYICFPINSGLGEKFWLIPQKSYYSNVQPFEVATDICSLVNFRRLVTPIKIIWPGVPSSFKSAA